MSAAWPPEYGDAPRMALLDEAFAARPNGAAARADSAVPVALAVMAIRSLIIYTSRTSGEAKGRSGVTAGNVTYMLWVHPPHSSILLMGQPVERDGRSTTTCRLILRDRGCCC